MVVFVLAVLLGNGLDPSFQHYVFQEIFFLLKSEVINHSALEGQPVKITGN
jgi:hypothetical protein